MKDILLVDFCTWEGHHKSYYLQTLTALSEANYKIYAYCCNNNDLQQFIDSKGIENCQVLDINLSTVEKIFFRISSAIDQCLDLFIPCSRLSFRSLFPLFLTRHLSHQCLSGKSTPVFFAHLDSALPRFPLWFSKCLLPERWGGVMITPSYRMKVNDQIKAYQQFRAEEIVSLSKGILVLHPKYQKYFKHRFSSLIVNHLPELCPPLEKRCFSIAEHVTACAAGRKIISILGLITYKRDVLLFLEAAVQLPADRYFISIIGRLDKNKYSPQELARIHFLIEQLSDYSFVKIDYYIPTEAEFNAVLGISDLVFLYYNNHPYSSNVLAKSMMYKKPVIVSEGYIMAETVRKYKWTAVVTPNPSKVAETMMYVLDKFDISETSYQEFSCEYSLNCFDEKIVDACSLISRL